MTGQEVKARLAHTLSRLRQVAWGYGGLVANRDADAAAEALELLDRSVILGTEDQYGDVWVLYGVMRRVIETGHAGVVGEELHIEHGGLVLSEQERAVCERYAR